MQPGAQICQEFHGCAVLLNLNDDLINIKKGFQSLHVKMLIRKLFERVHDTTPDSSNIKLGDTASQVNEILHKVDPTDVKPLGKPFPRVDGLLLATGNAQFVDDMPSYKKELYMAFVNSTKAHARILNVNPSKALNLPGVKHFISAKDVPEGKNKFSNFGEVDEDVFAEEIVAYEGHPIGAILAEEEDTAKKAAMMVEIEYEELTPIVTMQDAVTKDSFFANPPYFPIAFTDGDPEEALTTCEYVHEGECTTPRQEHFYEETVNMVVVPENDDMMKIYTPNQGSRKKK